jgi:hypothetical protein
MLNITEFSTKGFVKLHEPDGLDIISIDKFRLPNTEERLRDNTKNDVDPELAVRMDTFACYLQTKYINPIWPKNKYNKFIAFEDVDKDNQGWHTDMFEKYDMFFLYYLDDTHEATGGSIHFKWKTTGIEETYSFQPKAGDLVLVNNSKGFWHRAESTSIKRRVVSFDFNI